MISAGALLLTVFLQVGPDGWAVGRTLANSSLGPVRLLGSTAAGLWLVYHEVDAAPMAFYQPPQPLSSLVSAGSAGGRQPLVGLALPRLVLYAPFYQPPRPLDELAVDTAEYLLHALLEARLEAEIAVGGSFSIAARQRAGDLVLDLPREDRLPAYLAAAADFGSHVVGVANELERVTKRRIMAGRAPCPASGGPLFAHWPRIFAGGQFRPHLTDAGGATRWSVHPLERRDQELLLREVMGSTWSGDLVTDLPGLCLQAAAEAER